jgi:hypothetical protein
LFLFRVEVTRRGKKVEGEDVEGGRVVSGAGSLAPPPKAVMSLHLCQVGVWACVYVVS